MEIPDGSSVVERVTRPSMHNISATSRLPERHREVVLPRFLPLSWYTSAPDNGRSNDANKELVQWLMDGNLSSMMYTQCT